MRGSISRNADLDELGIAEDTIVIYSTVNGAEVFSWPDGETIPFHREKATCWESGFRVDNIIKQMESARAINK